MITYLNLIDEAIWELKMRGSKNENLLIAISPLVEFILKKEVFERGFIVPHINTITIDKYMGIEFYKFHPYNEIVVYDKDGASYNTSLLIQIPVENMVSHFISPKSEQIQ